MTTPLSEGLCINTQHKAHSVHWRENEPLSSDPSTLQLDTLPGLARFADPETQIFREDLNFGGKILSHWN